MIAIVDYGMGNLRSVEKAFAHVGARSIVTNSAKEIANASKVVLPGVGAFSECMKNLSERGLDEAVVKAVESGKPFLGICLGLQLLFDESDEEGVHKGLGVIKGRVIKFADKVTENGAELKVPHMGWNSVTKKKTSKLLDGIGDDAYFYFVHSYYALPTDKNTILTTTPYGQDFVSSIEKDNVHAFQFHPEKSQKAGLKILNNFASL